MNQQAIQDAKNIVLVVQGGIGRNIMATAVVRNLKAAYPDKRLVVVCGSPDIFLQNPHVYRVYSAANPVYFYEDFIKDSRSAFLNVEPYQHFDYLYKRKHFVEAWCEMLGIPCDSVTPEMFFTENEMELARAHVQTFDRDFVLCQFDGGKIPEGKDQKARLIARNAMYRRSVPEAIQTKIGEALSALNYRVCVVAHENQFIPGMADRIFFPIRAIIALIPYANAIVGIDSFLQHAAAAMKKQSLVLWAGTSPITLGYESHINLRREVCETPECHRPNSYLFDIEPSGYQWECPWNNRCCDYEVEEVMKAFEQMTGGRRGESRLGKPAQQIRANGFNPYSRPEPCPAHAGQNGAHSEKAGACPA